MESNVEHHFLVAQNFLQFTSANDLKTLYDAIKTTSIFAAFHPDEDSGHIHIVTLSSQASKSQKIQNLMNKLKRRIPGLDFRGFSETLKSTNHVIEKKDREKLAITILENGQTVNTFCGKTTPFTTLVLNKSKTFGSDPEAPKLGTLSCLSRFSPSAIVKSGLKDGGFGQEDQCEQEGNCSDESEDDDDDDEDDGGEPKKKRRALTKLEKYEMIERDVEKTNSWNIKQFYLRSAPSRYDLVP